MSKTLFIITGGTIDSLIDGYDSIAIFEDGQKSLIPDYINQQYPDNQDEFQTICMLDSNELADNHRVKADVLQAIEQTNLDKIILTHGTDTMADMANYLKLHIKKDIVIALVGAMIPLRDSKTDGYNNLDFAVDKLAKLAKGVYLVMDNKVFEAGKFRKDFEKKKFVELVNERQSTSYKHR